MKACPRGIRLALAAGRPRVVRSRIAATNAEIAMTRPHDPDAWMWAQACELVERAERMHRQFFRLSTQAAAWEPPVDVFEDDAELVIVVAMPGVGPEQVQVRFEDGTLIVRGTRSLPAPGHAVRRLEIPYGAFERRIALPAARFEPGAPTLQQGCLVVRLRKL
jgi:HSP20 family molecular chaperone IbpA